MRTAHLLTVVGEGVSPGGCPGFVCVFRGVSRLVSREVYPGCVSVVCPRGCVYPGGVLGCVQGGVTRKVYTPKTQKHTPNQSKTPPCEQNDWQTGVKTLPSLNFVCGR